MSQSEWWFSPPRISEPNNSLLPGATRFQPGCQAIGKSSPLSIYMRGAFIKESLDPQRWSNKKGTSNDLLIVSSFQTGTAPTVQRVHYFKESQDTNSWVGSFFNSIVCSFLDFQDSHVTLQTQVYDIDSYDQIKEIVSGIASMSGNVAVTFPVIAPYIAAGSGVALSVLEVLNQLDKHDKIIESNLRLEMGEDDTGSQLLQTGHWVNFSEPQKEGLKLSQNLRVIDRTTDKTFDDCSYVVYSVKKEEIPEAGWEIDQKIAKLLSELSGKGNSGKAAIDFLRDTMEGYTKFKKIKRIQELQRKKELTDDESRLLDTLTSDESIQPYIKND